MRQLEFLCRENPAPPKTERLPPKLEDEALRALVVLMAEAILAVLEQREVDDER